MKLYVLCDNTASGRGVLAEHGLSLLLEHQGSRIVFDAGQSDVFARNAACMGVDLSAVDALVVSHGHYDHTGGIATFCSANQKAPVYMQQAGWRQRYRPSRKDSAGLIDIGVPDIVRQLPDLCARLQSCGAPVEIAGRIKVSGIVPRCHELESDPGDFMIADGGDTLMKDMFSDEQIMIAEGDRGIYVFIGCAHAGVMNCIDYAKSLFPGKKVAGVIAGMHMATMPEQRYEATMEYLQHLDPGMIIPLHCTGLLATAELKNHFGDRCRICGAGDAVLLE